MFTDLWGLGGRRRKLIIRWPPRNAKQAQTQEHSTVHASHRRLPPVGAWAQNVRLSTSARCSCGCRNHRSVPCDASEAASRLSVGEILSTCSSSRWEQGLHVSREITTIVAPYSVYTACAYSGSERELRPYGVLASFPFFPPASSIRTQLTRCVISAFTTSLADALSGLR